MFDSLKNDLSEKWGQLQTRERITLAIGSTFLLLFLAYVLIWRPVHGGIIRLRSSLPQMEQQLSQMRVQAAQINKLKNRGASIASDGNILSLIEQSIVRKNIKSNLSKLEPDGENGARINLDMVAFNTLAEILTNLQQQHGLRVTAATIDTVADDPGVVNARINLRAMSK